MKKNWAWLLALLYAGTVRGQQPTVVAVMESGTPLTAQRVLLSPKFPEREVMVAQNQSYNVHGLDAAPGLWTTLLAHGTGWAHQGQSSSLNVPKNYLERAKDRSNLVGPLAADGTRWAAFGNQFPIPPSQQVLYLRQGIEEVIQKAAKRGWALTHIAEQATNWVLIFTQDEFDYPEPQTWFGETIHQTQLEGLLAAGRRIALVAQAGGKWFVTSTADIPGRRQHVRVDTSFPAEWMNEHWAIGDRVTQLVVRGLQVSGPIDYNNLEFLFPLLVDAADSSAVWYEAAIPRRAPHPDAWVALRRLIARDLNRGDYPAATATLNRFAALFPARQADVEVLRKLYASPERQLNPEALTTVNSKADEYKPAISADGTRLYFTALERKGGPGAEDLWVAERGSDGQWQAPKPLPEPVNTYASQSVTSVSADGTIISMFGTYNGGFFNLGDVYQSYQTAFGWSPPEAYPPPIKSDYLESDAQLTPDGRALIFVSTRPFGQGTTYRKNELAYGHTWGNTDIYICPKTETGWGRPINLGPMVNTPDVERTPYLHPDGKTLYFSSAGHPGFGGLDVFKVERMNDSSWTEWSTPVNLGKGFNSPADDWSYKVSTDGRYAYYASDQAQRANGDLYRVELPKELRPSPVVTVRGRVTDPAGKPLPAALGYEDLKTVTPAGELNANPTDGTYFIALPLGTDYGYTATLPGYFTVSQRLDLTAQTTALDTTVNITLYPVEELAKGETVLRLNNLFFDYDQGTLQPRSTPDLNRLKDFLNANPNLHAELLGHTDDQGSPAYNQDLSNRRAEAVRAWLVANGIAATRLKSLGFGESQPVTTNATEAGRAQNRRVEVKFYTPS